MENNVFDYDESSESCIIDAQICNNDYNNLELFDDELTRINEDEAIFDIIGGHYFLPKLRDFGKNVTIEAIHKINRSKSIILQARLQCFRIFQLALLGFNYDDNNSDDDDGDGDGDDDDGVAYSEEYAWYCDSKEGIQSIVSNGFGCGGFGSYHGIRLFPINSLSQGVQNCEEDNDGLKHALLCRVLVKNKNSSSDNSDTDEAISPSQYFVSSTKMNTHILPEYIVTFKNIPFLEGTRNNQHKWKTSAISSPWLPFKTLIPIISKFLPPYTMRLIIENYKDFEAGKISRQDWIQRLRQFAGNDLLTKIIKSFGAHNSEAI